MEAQLRSEVINLPWRDREKYLSSVAKLIDEMLNENPTQEYWDKMKGDYR